MKTLLRPDMQLDQDAVREPPGRCRPEPGNAAHLLVAGYPGTLRQAVRCLVDNATDHTPLGTAVIVSVAPYGLLLPGLR